jgi:hypothetical protein
MADWSSCRRTTKDQAGDRGEESAMAKKARRRRARAKSKANHGKRPNA